MKKILLIVVVIFGQIGICNAALFDRGDGLIYDSDLDITWLSSAIFAAGSPFDDGFSSTDGRMTWASANSWAASLTVGGSTDWRLPTTLDPDSSCTDNTAGTIPSADPVGWNCTGSEMGHLFYDELGGTAGTNILTSGDPDLALFADIRSPWTFWSSTEFAPNSNNAWLFFVSSGLQNGFDKDTNEAFAFAVHDGDVAQPVILAEIDIKPGSDPNCFNINGHGVIPVAILGSVDFDVFDIDISSLFFAGLEVRVRGKKGPLCHVEDSNGDVYLDLVCQFEDDTSMWALDSSAEATLTGKLTDGTDFEDTDSICVTQEVP